MKIKLLFLLTTISLISCDSSNEKTGKLPPSLLYHATGKMFNPQESYRSSARSGDSIESVKIYPNEIIRSGHPFPAEKIMISLDTMPEILKVKAPDKSSLEKFPVFQNKQRFSDSIKKYPLSSLTIQKRHSDSIWSNILTKNFPDTIQLTRELPLEKEFYLFNPKNALVTWPSDVKNSPLDFQYMDIEHHFKTSHLTDIVKDLNGKLWISDYKENIAYYDGSTITHLGENEGYNGNVASSLYVDSKGNLWITSLRGGLDKFDGEIFTHYFDNDYVIGIVEDNDGSIWIAKSGGLVRLNNSSYKIYPITENPGTNIINSIELDNKGNIWIGGPFIGIAKFDGEFFTLFPDIPEFHNGWISAILCDTNGNVWISSVGNGVFKFTESNLFQYTEQDGLISNSIYNILEDEEGIIWFLGMENGICSYNGRNLTKYNTDLGYIKNATSSVLYDSCGNYWFTTIGGGLCKYRPHSFINYTFEKFVSDNRISKLIEDNYGNYWISTWMKGIIYFDENIFHYYNYQSLIENTPNSINTIEGAVFGINTMIHDIENNIWYTDGSGVACFDGRYIYHYKVENGLISSAIHSIFEDRRGNLWFGSNSGISKLVGSEITNFPDLKVAGSKGMSSIQEDKNGNIWFINQFGGVSKYDGKTVIHFTEKEGIHDNDISAIYIDNQDLIWLGGSEGISCINEDTIWHFTGIRELNNRRIASLISDTLGNLWVGTNAGIIKIKVIKNIDGEYRDQMLYSVNSYGLKDGLKSIAYNGVCIDSKNRIWWGSDKSLTMLDLNTFSESENIPQPKLRQLRLNDANINYRNLADELADQLSFDSVKKFENYPYNLKVSSKYNHLTFHFSAIHWAAPHKVIYSYRMLGQDDNWSSPSNVTHVDFRDIRFGRYTFQICAAGENGIWSQPFEYKFRVLPPWWHSWWMYIIYTVSLFLLIRFYIRFSLSKERIQSDLKMKNIEVEKIKDLESMKSRFFTNITHEFRTPLSLLVGPLEDSIKRREDEVPMKKKILRIMHRNANRLQLLISQLLDVSKLEAGMMELQLVKGDLSKFARIITSSFASLAESKHISFGVDIESHPGKVCFDEDKMEKIINNLLSNALKFTPDGGSVSFKLTYSDRDGQENIRNVNFSVTDSGIGMDQKQQEHIFDRFYQVSDSDTRDAEGTGIGLSLTKELVELFDGTITVISSPGAGTTFKVVVPVDEESLCREMEADATSITTGKQSLGITDQDEVAENENVVEGASENIILVVEDNEDLRQYIGAKFTDGYQVIQAVNGTKGFTAALEYIPDLIITDLMMPVMGGLEMSEKLKNHPATNHIPIVMLTAKADKKSRLEGLEAWADDYITKPFDSDELLARVNNLISQRERLREQYITQFLSEKEEPGQTNNMDQHSTRIMTILEQGFTNPEFSVDQWGKNVGLSRSQLYRKILAFSGKKPVEMIRLARLKKAAQMIKEGETDISLVMFNSGFNNPSMFAKYFREQYGLNPSDYSRKLQA